MSLHFEVWPTELVDRYVGVVQDLEAGGLLTSELIRELRDVAGASEHGEWSAEARKAFIEHVLDASGIRLSFDPSKEAPDRPPATASIDSARCLGTEATDRLLLSLGRLGVTAEEWANDAEISVDQRVQTLEFVTTLLDSNVRNRHIAEWVLTLPEIER